MSIPKEPRQLMINIMYIVLTAILALNVSAEILNAFFTMDNSLSASNSLVESTNAQIRASINEQAEAYPQFSPFKDKAAQAEEITKAFFDHLSDLRNELIEGSGGLDEENMPVGKKDKDITTRLLVDEGKGDVLEQLIGNTRDQLLSLIDEEDKRAAMALSIPLKVAELPEGTDKKTWAQFNFFQMPIAAVLPILTKLQNDAKVAETALLNYFVNEISYKPTLDEYAAIVSSDKSYVIKNEEYKAEIFLGAYSTTTDNISIKVDGRSVPVRNGKAMFSVTPNDIGNKSYEAVISVLNPLTGERKNYKKTFNFEVGERSVTASADKMNVFYIGVDNPLSISAAGVPSALVEVNGEGGLRLTKKSNGKYNVRATRPGKAKVMVSGGGLVPTSFEYRVKKIPDPVVKLGRQAGGTIGKSTFTVHEGLVPHLENFDFEATCTIQGFEVARVRKGKDVQYALNQGGKFKGDAKRIVKGARQGDIYYFDKIKVRCPGDTAGRKINGLMFKIR